MSRKPDFFIVGAPKSGTTAMANYLEAHPEVFMARKEMHTFGSDLRFGRQFYRRAVPDYLAEFNSWNGQLRAGEASVWYLLSTAAAAELKTFNPEARIVIMLREPTEMLHSLYYQFVFDGNEHLPTFEDALAAEPDRRAGRRIPRSAYFPQGLVYRQTIRYADQVQRYFDAFGSDRVRVILYDEFKADVAGTYRGVLEFLEVDSSCANVDFKVINPTKSARSRILRALLADPWLRGAAIAARPWVPTAFFAALQYLDERLRQSNTRVASRTRLSPELTARLKREFAPEVDRLSQMLNRDLNHWNKVNPASINHSSVPVWLPKACEAATPLLHGP